MNSNRVYRQKRTSDYIIEELTKNKGTQFDPEIAEIMLQLIKEEKVKCRIILSKQKKRILRFLYLYYNSLINNSNDNIE